MRKLRVAFLSHLDVNLERFRLPLMECLREFGAEVLAVSPEGPYLRKIKEKGIKIRTYRLNRRNTNPLREVPSILDLSRIVREERPHILQTFTLKPNLLGGILKRVHNLPVVIGTVTGLGSIFLEDGKLLKVLNPALRWTFNSLDFVIFQNPDDREEFIKRGFVNETKSCVIEGAGVDIDYYSPESVDKEKVIKLRNELGLRDETVFLFIGRFIVHKGVNEFVEAAKRLKEEGKRVRFIMVGGRDEGNPYSLKEEELEKLRRESVVEIYGFRDDVRELIALSDVFVLPSYREGLSRSVLEAQAMEKPVIATNVTGLKEIVEDGVTGILVEPKDSHSLFLAMKKFLENPELRKEMGRRGRARVKERFSVERIIKEHLELYRMLLSRRLPDRIFVLRRRENGRNN